MSLSFCTDAVASSKRRLLKRFARCKATSTPACAAVARLITESSLAWSICILRTPLLATNPSRYSINCCVAIKHMIHLIFADVLLDLNHKDLPAPATQVLAIPLATHLGHVGISSGPPSQSVSNALGDPRGDPRAFPSCSTPVEVQSQRPLGQNDGTNECKSIDWQNAGAAAQSLRIPMDS